MRLAWSIEDAQMKRIKKLKSKAIKTLTVRAIKLFITAFEISRLQTLIVNMEIDSAKIAIRILKDKTFAIFRNAAKN